MMETQPATPLWRTKMLARYLLWLGLCQLSRPWDKRLWAGDDDD